jgi:hypothetical protein
MAAAIGSAARSKPWMQEMMARSKPWMQEMIARSKPWMQETMARSKPWMQEMMARRTSAGTDKELLVFSRHTGYTNTVTFMAEISSDIFLMEIGRCSDGVLRLRIYNQLLSHAPFSFARVLIVHGTYPVTEEPAQYQLVQRPSVLPCSEPR